MNLPAALSHQARVLGALILRETTAAFGTSQIGYLWAVITPAAGTAILVAIFTAAGRQPPFGESLGLFFATGLLTLDFFSKLNSGLMGAMDANKALLAYPPIRETDVLFARAILVAAVHAAIMAMFFSALAMLGMAGSPAEPADIAAAFAVTFLLGLGFGMLNGVIISVWASWRHIEAILTRPLFFLSGIFFVPSYLPPPIPAWLAWNPVLHCVEWMRSAFYRDYASTVLDRSYVLGCALLLVLAGLMGERISRRRRGSA
jgi:capsular polysaccharide transport system permease protein